MQRKLDVAIGDKQNAIAAKEKAEKTRIKLQQEFEDATNELDRANSTLKSLERRVKK